MCTLNMYFYGKIKKKGTEIAINICFDLSEEFPGDSEMSSN